MKMKKTNGNNDASEMIQTDNAYLKNEAPNIKREKMRPRYFVVLRSKNANSVCFIPLSSLKKPPRLLYKCNDQNLTNDPEKAFLINLFLHGITSFYYMGRKDERRKKRMKVEAQDERRNSIIIFL